jgi:hypothetical protein
MLIKGKTSVMAAIARFIFNLSDTCKQAVILWCLTTSAAGIYILREMKTSACGSQKEATPTVAEV